MLSNNCANIKCRGEYISKYAHINKNPVHIDTFLESMIKHVPKCINDHELILNDESTYFIHKNVLDTHGRPSPYEYSHLVANYPFTSVNVGKNIKNDKWDMYYDVLLGDEYNSVIQIRYNPITQYHVCDKTNRFNLRSKNIIWIITCNEPIEIENYSEREKKISFKDSQWKYKNFVNFNCIFLTFFDIIVRINPNDVKDNVIITDKVYKISDFIKSTINNVALWKEYIMENNDIIYSPPESPLQPIKRCNGAYISRYAYINSKPVHIQNLIYILDGRHECHAGHELICESATINELPKYFVHKNKCDTEEKTLSYFHAEWQSNFPYTERYFYKISEHQVSNRYSDIILEDYNLVVEIQHSYISEIEVNTRKNDYRLHGYEIIWVIDCEDDVLSEIDNGFLILFKSKWKYNSFLNYDYIFLSFGDFIIIKIDPKSVTDRRIYVNQTQTKENFIKSLINNNNLWNCNGTNKENLYNTNNINKDIIQHTPNVNKEPIVYKKQIIQEPITLFSCVTEPLKFINKAISVIYDINNNQANTDSTNKNNKNIDGPCAAPTDSTINKNNQNMNKGLNNKKYSDLCYIKKDNNECLFDNVKTGNDCCIVYFSFTLSDYYKKQIKV